MEGPLNNLEKLNRTLRLLKKEKAELLNYQKNYTGSRIRT